MPTSLLKVKLEPGAYGESCLSGPRRANPEPLYVVYWAASFTVGQTRFCTSDPNATHRPQVGERLLFFYPYPRASVDQEWVLGGRFFFESPGGELLHVDTITTVEVLADASSLDEVEERLVESLCRHDEPGDPEAVSKRER